MELWPSFDKDYADLYRFAFRMGRDRDVAEDMVQEAMLRLARDAKAPRDDDARRRWLFVVVRNLCLSDLRRSSRHPEADIEDCPPPSTKGPSPSGAASNAELGQWIERAIASLAPDQREAIVLREYEGMDYAEIAEATGSPIGTVRSRLARGRAALREFLRPILEDEK